MLHDIPRVRMHVVFFRPDPSSWRYVSSTVCVLILHIKTFFQPVDILLHAVPHVMRVFFRADSLSWRYVSSMSRKTATQKCCIL